MLVACEFSGVVRRAFEEQGHEAWSCDLLPSLDNSPMHMQCDLRSLPGFYLKPWRYWDLIVAHPPCTYLCSSGLHNNLRVPGRAEKTEAAIRFVRWIAGLPVPRIAIENPVGILSPRWRKPDQYIQPWQFGHPETKKTGLWLKNLPLLVPTKIVEPVYQMNKDGTVYKDKKGKRYNPKHYSSGTHADRWKVRSLTYDGIAEAMATQWGGL